MRHGEVVKIESEYLHSNVSVGVVMPNQVDKVVLLLHGHGGSFKALDDNLPLTEYAQENNALIVTPNMDNGYYMDRESHCVSEFIARELPDYVCKTYNVDPTVKKYIAGISMGGYGSMLVGAKYSEVFEKIIAISGAFIVHDVVIGNPQLVGSDPGYYMRTFAPIDTLEEDEERNPVAAVTKCKIPIVMTCGTEDSFCERNEKVLEVLRKNEIAFDWCPIDGGGHDYECFDKGIRYAFEKMDI